MPRRHHHAHRRLTHEAERSGKRWHVGRRRAIELARHLARHRLGMLVVSGAWREIARALGARNAFTFAFYYTLMARDVIPDRYMPRVRETLSRLAKLAMSRLMERIARRMPTRYTWHPHRVNITVPYSELRALATLARLAYMLDNIDQAPYMSTLAKHPHCNSSRLFIVWDGTREGVKFYYAYNTVKRDSLNPAPNTGDKDNLTLPMLSVWLWKFEDYWTTILDLLMQEMADMTKSRAAVTRNGRGEPVHTLPAILVAYTDHPMRIRGIMLGLPEETDSMYHCSLYMMPIHDRPLKSTRRHRVYEARWWRRYRRMEGWLA